MKKKSSTDWLKEQFVNAKETVNELEDIYEGIAHNVTQVKT